MRLDFFVIGAQKSGSTSIYRYLLAHPDVFVSQRENADYYSYGLGTVEVYERPGVIAKSWANAVKSKDAYRDLFQARTVEKIAGDCSDSQYFYPGTAERIKADHPQAKIIAVLRHPVARAYSGFNHARSSGMEPEADFARCMQRSVQQEANLSPIMRYKSLGMYGNLLHPFATAFGRQNILLIDFADVTADFAKVANSLSAFLSIPAFEIEQVWANRTLVPPASGPGAWIYGLARPLRSALKGTKPHSKRRAAIKAMQKRVFTRPQKLPEDMLSQFMPIFADDICQLTDDFGEGFWRNWR